MADVSISLIQLLNDDDDEDFRQHDVVDETNSFPCWFRDFDDSFDAFASADLSDLQSRRRGRAEQSSDGDAFDGDCIDFFDRDNQVNFVMDLFHQRVEQSQSPLQVIMDPNLADPDPGFVNEQPGSAQLEMDLERGLGLRGEGNPQSCENSSFLLENCDDEPHYVTGLRVIDMESDSDSDKNSILGLNFNAEDIDDDVICGPNMYENESDDPSLRLCWESFQLEDHREAVNEDFEWEEIDGRIEEQEILSFFLENDGISVPAQEERNVMGNLEWEVLLNDHNLVLNPELRNQDFDLGDEDQDEYNYTAEYETMFTQFADAENALITRPPASKSVVKNLPEVILSKENDPEKNDAACAICKDEMVIGEAVKILPCSHKYHQNCIFPWLGITNTCPVCRYELPTDDPEYERKRRAQSQS
ncbi:hypothetical protein DM860_010021 [Cuscuta australis]|uniref:RING-type E3 ubiquitin transferase n=1 Tax=Cuscuta australis TaxID=267555 RepID=A0A328D5Z3_9ASTE|nr:hypothetical protein DM860_010021 [Cuscuta australis]